MAVSHPQSARAAEPALIWPSIDELDLDRVRLDYDSEIDYFYVFFHGKSLPAVQILLDDGWTYASELLDEDESDTGRVVGLMIEGFRDRALPEHPEWRELADFAGPAAESGDRDAVRRRAAIARLITDAAAMPVYDGTGRPPRGDLLYARFEVKVERDEETGRLVGTATNLDRCAVEGDSIAEVFARLGEVIAHDFEADGVKA